MLAHFVPKTEIKSLVRWTIFAVRHEWQLKVKSVQQRPQWIMRTKEATDFYLYPYPCTSFRAKSASGIINTHIKDAHCKKWSVRLSYWLTCHNSQPGKDCKSTHVHFQNFKNLHLLKYNNNQDIHSPYHIRNSIARNWHFPNSRTKTANRSVIF
jgi:hypothetical protein